MTAALYSLFRRNLTTRARLASFGLATLAVLGVAWVVGQGDSSDPPIDVASTFLAEAVLSLYLPIAALVFGASAFGDLIEDHTLVYIWLRPIRRVVIVLSALLAVVFRGFRLVCHQNFPKFSTRLAYRSWRAPRTEAYTGRSR